jgi:hypothetical protein
MSNIYIYSSAQKNLNDDSIWHNFFVSESIGLKFWSTLFKIIATNWFIGELTTCFGGTNFLTIDEVLKLYFGSFTRQKRKPANIILTIAEDCINVWIELYQPTLPKRAVVKKTCSG